MNRKGFTLIELLIVGVIIGILAAIAIPKFANTKEKAYIASMKSDLRNLVTAEEAYFADSVKYTAAYGAGGVNFVQSTGNTTPAVTTTADGWTANITNVNTTKTCSIYIGSTALLPANKEGRPQEHKSELQSRTNPVGGRVPVERCLQICDPIRGRYCVSHYFF